MNNTSFGYTSSRWSIGRCDFTDAESKFDAFVYIFIAVFAIFENVTVVMCYHRFRSLKTITNLCVLSLTASDIMVAIFSVPFTFGVYLCQLRPPVDKRNIGDFIYLFCDMLPSILSIYSLSMVAIDRLMAVSSPYLYQRYVTQRTALSGITVMWLFVTFLVGLILVFDRRQFTLFIVFMSYVFPVTFMIVSYTIIGYVAVRHAKAITKWEQTGIRLKKDSRAFTYAGDMHPSSEGKTRVSKVSKISQVSINEDGIIAVDLNMEDIEEEWVPPSQPNNVWREIKAAVRLLLLLTVFIVAWTPFMALNIKFYVCEGQCDIDGRLLKYFKMLHYLNSALNPLLYIALSKRWRAAFIMAVCRPSVSSQVGEMTITSTRDWS